MARQGEDMTRRIALSDSLADGRGRFLVGGQATQAASGEIKMYEWRKEVGQMGMIGLQTDVGQIRAMAWSPMPTHRNLVATGLSSGRTVLLNVSPATLALPANNTAPSSSQFTVAQLSVKHIRAVTAVAFSPVDSNYLATGYDRHRSDYSLLIWDVADAISRLQPENNSSWLRPLGRLDINNPQAKDPRWLPTEPRPIQQYCPNETINSLCFLHSDIHSLLVGANGKSIRLYDLRAPNPPPAGTSPRDNSVIPGVSAQWATRAVNGLAADPNRGERFASFELNSGECVVKVFDVRKPGMETLSFKVTGTVVALEWLQDGRLAAGTKEHGVTLWNFVTGSHETKDGKEDFTEVGGMRMLSTPKKDLHSFAFPSTPSGQKDILVVKKDGSLSIGPIGESPTLASASRGDMVISTSTKLHVVSPDDAPPRSRASSTSSHGDTHKNDDEDDKASISFEDYKRQNRFQMAPEGVNRILAEAGASRGGRQKSGLSSGYQTPRSTEKGARFGEMRDYVDEKEEIMGGFDGLGRILRGDMGYAMRCKAEEGYGLADLHLNAAISTRFTGRDRLAGVWELLDHLITVMPPSTSTYREYDLSHYGLYPLWLSLNLTRSNEDSNTTPPRPTATSSSHLTPPVGPELPASSNSTGSRRETVKQGSSAWSNVARSTNVPSPVQKSGNSPQNLPSAEQENGFQEAVLAINEKRTDNGQLGSIGSGKLPPTDKEAQRRMMVVICGEGRDKAVISEVNRLIEDGQRTKAACWAYFSGDEEPAISILMNSDNEKHRLMASTIAGFLTQSRALRGSEFWNSHWPSLINKVDDPYIRAILLKIGGDNWESVLEEEAIPLLDRVAIAMFHLSDKALTNFLKDRYQRCLRHASLHGLLLTGLTSLAIPLLQAFLDRTSDIQTVSLLSAFIPSSQLDAKEKKQVERWVEGYRDLLDSWGMFTARSNFDVHRWERLRKLGEEMGDERIICPACNNQVGKVEEGHINRNAVLRSTTTWPNERTTTCSLCTSVLPRCIICLLHVQPRFADPWEEEPSLADTLDAAYVCCLSCRHGGHANHILPWFNGGLDGEPGHDQCAVAGCNCECANI